MAGGSDAKPVDQTSSEQSLLIIGFVSSYAEIQRIIHVLFSSPLALLPFIINMRDHPKGASLYHNKMNNNKRANKLECVPKKMDKNLP